MPFYKIHVPHNPEKMSLVTLEVDAPFVGCMLMKSRGVPPLVDSTVDSGNSKLGFVTNFVY